MRHVRHALITMRTIVYYAMITRPGMTLITADVMMDGTSIRDYGRSIITIAGHATKTALHDRMVRGLVVRHLNVLLAHILMN